MRSPASAFLAALLVGGCQERSHFTPPPETESDPGSIAGRVCDPSNRTWLPDAQVYTYLYSDDGHIRDTRVTWSDRDGYWLLDELPSEIDYKVYVQHGYGILDKDTVYVGDGEDVVLDEPVCLDPLAVDVAVVTGDYDNFQDVLVAMGFANYDLVDGIDREEVQSFLLDPSNLVSYDIIFFNSGFVEEDVIYDTDGSDFHGYAAIIRDNLAAYVEAGGSVYASAKAYDVVEQIWPSRVNWIGNDDQPNDAQVGVEGDVIAGVADRSLAEFMGRNYLEIALDGAGWPVMQNAAERVRVHLAGSVEYKIGDRTYTLPTSPILVSFSSGDGSVVVSSFRFSENATDDMLLVLQYLMTTL